jgi:hypothetical protein
LIASLIAAVIGTGLLLLTSPKHEGTTEMRAVINNNEILVR